MVLLNYPMHFSLIFPVHDLSLFNSILIMVFLERLQAERQHHKEIQRDLETARSKDVSDTWPDYIV